MRAANRAFRVVVALVVLGLAVGWLLRRRSAAMDAKARLTVVPPPSGHSFVEVSVESEPPADAPPAGDPPPGPVPPTVDEGLAAPAVPDAAASAAPAAGPAGQPVGQGGEDDDLRQIRGIGPASESTLHGLGIRTFRQLATLGDADRERIRDAIRDVRQRIEREDWAGQARELHRAKYGEYPGTP